MFSKAIVRTPCRKFINGLTTANLGPPDYDKALGQHAKYIKALKTCGLDVTVLPADESYPDSTFVEDTALLTPRCAIIMNPGAPSRKGEILSMRPILEKFYQHIESISEPGSVDAGDILMVGNHYYIGLSGRTNQAGAIQLINILKSYSLTGSMVRLNKVLHLKTGVAYLENNNLLVTGEFSSKPEFRHFNILPIDSDESYAANCIWINNTVLVPQGYPKAKETIQKAGYKIIALDMSEFRKLDGGLSCLSLRF